MVRFLNTAHSCTGPSRLLALIHTQTPKVRQENGVSKRCCRLQTKPELSSAVIGWWRLWPYSWAAFPSLTQPCWDFVRALQLSEMAENSFVATFSSSLVSADSAAGVSPLTWSLLLASSPFRCLIRRLWNQLAGRETAAWQIRADAQNQMFYVYALLFFRLLVYRGINRQLRAFWKHRNGKYCCCISAQALHKRSLHIFYSWDLSLCLFLF